MQLQGGGVMAKKSSDDIVRDLMPYVIKLVKETAYVDPNDPRATDADALGIIVAKYLKWSRSFATRLARKAPPRGFTRGGGGASMNRPS